MADSEGHSSSSGGGQKFSSSSSSDVFVHQEKSNHEYYLNFFRVEPCQLFKQHQCQQHRPYTCFGWHFANQRRRRPEKLEDGTFNYSPDTYCDHYDENTGKCPDGDECPYLHRVSGDVERKYHLRYYKTVQCVHSTDSRGQCAKNGAHCAHAHTLGDKRRPVLVDTPKSGEFEGGKFILEDPKWHVASHDDVLSAYKTELCRKPARLCRQGYACPYFHNSKDRRRPPALYKYRSTPCPAAKTLEEWLDPDGCDAGDQCQYCHSRTEQQFHPEIYKSTKCNDMLEHGYCPRATFCAFAHHDVELHEQRNVFAGSAKPSTIPRRVSTPNEFQIETFDASTVFEPPMFATGPPGPPPGPPGLERTPTGTPMGLAPMLSPIGNSQDARLRAQSINMGHLDMLKRSMMMGIPPHPSLYRADSGNCGNSLDELHFENMRIQENNHPSQFMGLQDKVQFLQEALEHERHNCEMWRMRFEGLFQERTRLQMENEHLKRFLAPLDVKVPEPEYNIRPSASLPHSPSYNIFDTEWDTGAAPACARCGRDPSSGSSSLNNCPVCSN